MCVLAAARSSAVSASRRDRIVRRVTCLPRLPSELGGTTCGSKGKGRETDGHHSPHAPAIKAASPGIGRGKLSRRRVLLEQEVRERAAVMVGISDEPEAQ